MNIIPAKFQHVQTTFSAPRGGKNRGKKLLNIQLQVELPEDFRQNGHASLMTFLEDAGQLVADVTNKHTVGLRQFDHTEIVRMSRKY